MKSSDMESQVCVWTDGAAGRIHLNRPEALNALNNHMVRILLKAIAGFEANTSIQAVIVTAEGEKAFCAGGDLKEIYQLGRQNVELAVRTWSEEYILNAKIAAFPKPWICLVDGLCMGAGMAMAVHGGYALLSEYAQLSMPEVQVGFYPDVAMSYHLSRLPAKIGYYYGMTGQPFSAEHAVELELARAIVPRESHDPFIADISRGDDVDDTIKRFSKPVAGFDAARLSAFCEDVFSTSREDSIHKTYKNNSIFGEILRQTINTSSPASQRITFEVIQAAEKLPSVLSCLQRDMQINEAILKRHDFYEGTFRLLLDRSQKPIWKDDPQTVWKSEFNGKIFKNLQGLPDFVQ